MNEKYVVFKKSEWDLGDTGFLELEPLPDAVVIRTQDIFAAAGLSAYEHNIRTTLALTTPEPEMKRQLETIADYFSDVAQEAEDKLARRQCKVPD